MTNEESNNFNGIYYPNLDVNITEEHGIEANFNFLPSDEEKAAYKSKYGVDYPYRTTEQFRNMVREVSLDYFKMLKDKVDQDDKDWLNEDNTWTAINLMVNAAALAGGGTALYQAYKCCFNLEDILNIIFNITYDPIDEVYRFLLRDKDDGSEDDRIINRKQDKLIDTKNNHSETEFNIRTIVTGKTRRGNYTERSLLTSSLSRNILTINFNGLKDIPNFKGFPEFNSQLPNQKDYGIQSKLILDEKDPIQLNLRAIYDPVLGRPFQNQIISSGMKFDNSFQIIDDPDEGFWRGARKKIYPNFSDVHFKDNTLQGYDPTKQGHKGAIKIGTIKHDHFDTSDIKYKIDAGNIRRIEKHNISDHGVYGDSIQNNCVKYYHIYDNTIKSANIASIEFNNINEEVFDNLREGSLKKLTDVKDYDGDKKDTAYHFSNMNQYMINKAKIFENRTLTEAKNTLIVLAYSGQERVDSELVNLYKLYLDPDEKAKYFKTFNDGLEKVNKTGESITKGLEDGSSEWSYNMKKYAIRTSQKYTPEPAWEVTDEIKLIKRGQHCILKGEVKLKDPITFIKGKIPAICLPTDVLIYYPPNQGIIENIFNPEEKRIYTVVLNTSRAALGLRQVHQLNDNGTVDIISNLPAGATINFSIDYLNDEVKIHGDKV